MESDITYLYVDDRKGLARALDLLLREPVLAFDLESDNNLHHYGSRICLMQFATPDHNIIIDPLSDIDLDPVRCVMEDEGIEIIFHDADFDMRSLDGEYGWRPNRLFDTLVAARLVGRTRFGIASLIEDYFDVRLEKKYQRADWSRRPLLDAMLGYAAGDVHYLLMLRERFLRELEELERLDWAREEFKRRESIRFEPDERPPFARVKGASELTGRQLAVLDELARVRDDIARKLDMPLYKVMADSTLVDLVKRPPRSPGSLKGRRGMHPFCRGDGAGRIVDAITRGREAKALKWPRKKRTGKRLHRSPKVYDALRGWRSGVASREGLEPDLVMPLTALKRLSGGLSPDEVLGEEPVRGWQLNAFGGELKAFLKGLK